MVTQSESDKGGAAAPPIVRLVLTPVAGHKAPFAALRRLLKVLLRVYGWRCTEAEGLPAEE